ncbi:MAG: DUF2061 domain-containing protein [Candidatus Thermoplasmatota archaeon]|nr:DUF2061 domain-containing protein [Candidatus Thermoplasmatota archaeon]
MNERKMRSLVKSITYRIICIMSLSIVTYIITRDLMQMGLIVLIFQTIQTVLYYLHERVWNNVRWGSRPPA